jgi:spore germination protein YaaH
MKRPDIFTTTAATAAVTLSLGLAACGSDKEAPQPAPAASATENSPTSTEASACDPTTHLQKGNGYLATYIPTWGDDNKFQEAATLQGINDIKVAFAVVDKNGKVSIDFGSAVVQQTIKTLAGRADRVDVAVGGYGSSEVDHKNILAGFDKGLKHPVAFSAQIAGVAEQTAKVAGVNKVGVDIDMEYPNDKQAAQLPTLVSELHKHGIGDVSMAVAAADDGEPVRKVAGKLAGMGVTFDVMSYDLNGPWAQPAGPITDINWMVQKVGAWVQSAGDAKRVAVGIPTYGYDFIGAQKAGDQFDQVATNNKANSEGPLSCSDVSANSLVRDPKTLTTGAKTADGWTSLVTPDDAADISKAVHGKYPQTSSFTWDITGMALAPGYVTALKQK